MEDTYSLFNFIIVCLASSFSWILDSYVGMADCDIIKQTLTAYLNDRIFDPLFLAGRLIFWARQNRRLSITLHEF